MKKFLLGLLFTVLSFIGHSQTVVHQEWKAERPGEWASFYWGVTRTQYADYQGKYYYYLYFYSNSYFNSKNIDGINYDRASTYVRDINISMTEYKVSSYNDLEYYNTVKINVPGYTCDWTFQDQYYVAWFWSYSPYSKFKITYSKVSAFDYSIY